MIQLPTEKPAKFDTLDPKRKHSDKMDSDAMHIGTVFNEVFN